MLIDPYSFVPLQYHSPWWDALARSMERVAFVETRLPACFHSTCCCGIENENITDEHLTRWVFYLRSWDSLHRTFKWKTCVRFNIECAVLIRCIPNDFVWRWINYDLIRILIWSGLVFHAAREISYEISIRTNIVDICKCMVYFAFSKW